MKSFERGQTPEIPSEQEPKPLEDAELLYHNPHEVEIYQRVEANKDAIRSGRFGAVGGPSCRSLGTVLSHLDGRGQPDLEVIDNNLPKLVTNALAMRTEITKASQEARNGIANFHAQHAADSDTSTAADQIAKMKSWWTPFMQFVRRVGAVNAADQGEDKKKQLPKGEDFSFRGFAKPDNASYTFSESIVSATANKLLYSIIFDANHLYREENDRNQLLHYVQQELRKLQKNRPSS